MTRTELRFSTEQKLLKSSSSKTKLTQTIKSPRIFLGDFFLSLEPTLRRDRIILKKQKRRRKQRIKLPPMPKETTRRAGTEKKKAGLQLLDIPPFHN